MSAWACDCETRSNAPLYSRHRLVCRRNLWSSWWQVAVSMARGRSARSSDTGKSSTFDCRQSVMQIGRGAICVRPVRLSVLVPWCRSRRIDRRPTLGSYPDRTCMASGGEASFTSRKFASREDGETIELKAITLRLNGLPTLPRGSSHFIPQMRSE